LQEAPGAARPDLAARVQARDESGVWPWYDRTGMEDRLDELGLRRLSKIGSATLRCVRARDMVDNTLAILRAEAELWLRPDFMAWWTACRAEKPA